MRKHLNDNIEQLRKKIEEQQQRHDDISREALHYKSSVNDLELDLRETKLELKKVKKHSAEQTIDQNKRYDELESVSAGKDSEIDKLLKELTLVKRESMSMNEKYENTAVELKHIVEAKSAMEQQFTEDNNSLRKELQKTSLQLDKLLESASLLEDRNQNLQGDIDQMEKHKVSVEAQLASETEARKRLASELERERGKYQRLNQQSNLEIDNVRQDLASMRRRAEDAERMIGDLRKKNEQTYEEFDKSKAEMRKQVDEILSAQAKEQAQFHEDNQEILNALEKAQDDLKNEEQHGTELRRSIELLKVEVEKKDLIVQKVHRREAELKEEIEGMENQMNRVRKDRSRRCPSLRRKIIYSTQRKN